MSSSPSPIGQSQLLTQPDQRILKLRQSCDACAASKVKCDKIHPHCGRCMTSGSTCVYSVSRKYGKSRPRAKPPDMINPSIQRPILPNQGATPDPQALFNQELQIPFDELMTDVGWSANVNSGEQLTPSWTFPMSEAPILPGGLSLVTNPESPDGFPNSVDYREYLNQDTTHIMDVPLGSTSVLSETSTAAAGPSHQQISKASDCRNKGCYRIAYSTLESLHPRIPLSNGTTAQNSRLFTFTSTPTSPSFSAAPGSPATPSTLTIDKILRRNKEAIRRVVHLLTCSCGRDPHLAMLYCSIISKILLWYQFAGGVENSTSLPRAPTATPTPPASNSDGDSVPVAYKCLPITAGEFELDEEDQKALGRQLLLSELRKAGQLIDRLTAKDSDSGDEGIGIGEAGELYAMLGAWLKAELLRTVSEIREKEKARLRMAG